MTPPDDLRDTLARFRNFLYARCGLAESTVSLMVGFIRRAAPHLGTNPSAEDLEAYVTCVRQSRCSYAHISNLLSAINRYTEFLGRPMHFVRPKRPNQLLIGVMSEAEIVRIIFCSENLRERAMLSLLAYSAIRNSELCNLLVGDVDRPNQMIVVRESKNMLSRRVCISGECLELLNEYMTERKGKPSDRLFLTVRKGNPYAPQDLRKLIRKAARRAGIERRIYPHLFRHSLATALVHRGAHPLTIQAQLGHRNLASTMVYIHNDSKHLQAEYRQYAPSFL